MKTEEQVWTVLVETNPVPNVDQYGRDEVGGAAYLATLEPRSSEVTQLETKREQEAGKSSWRNWVVAAAAFVAGASLAVILTNLGVGGSSPASGSGTGEIAFAHTIIPSGDSLFAANGDAVDQGLMCPNAIGKHLRDEDADGNTLTDQQQDALWSQAEPFVNVAVHQMICNDAGNFLLRIIAEIDPTDPEWSPEKNSVTWTITGGQQYETITGEGDGSPMKFRDFVEVRAASGSITDNG